jgi:dienelactone hydrolase
VAIALVILVGAGVLLRPYVHGLSFVIRAADMHGVLRRAADFDLVAVRESLVTIPLAGGASIRGRVFQPPHTRRAALVVSGLHPAGIDEPRLLRLAHQLSASNVTVVTPEIPGLSRFEITPAITEAIERAALWLSSDSALAPDHRVGLMGISFSGGLSIVAAGRPSLADRVAYVFALGGHDDLPRVLRYLCTGIEPQPFHEITLKPERPDATRAGPNEFVRSPHDYGVAVILLGIADRLVPRGQVQLLRDGVRRYLFASHLDQVDKPQAEREFAALRELATKLPEPSATLLRYVNERDVAHLGARLLPFIGLYGGDPALSVSKSPKPSAPVFLLHGIDDNVIPAVESEYLENDLRGRAPVRLLLSGLISHAEADQPVHFGEVMRLASFWGDLLSR